MLIPVGPVKNLPITILRVAHDPPLVVEAHITHFDGEVYRIQLPGADRNLKPGEQILIDFGEGATGRRRGRVRDISELTFTLELLGRPRPPDRREFPRIEGNVPLQYLLLDASERPRLESWLKHPHLAEATEEWRSPDPYMDFSATGIKMTAGRPLPAGTLLCLRFRLPGVSDQVFTCGGEVVRNDEQEDGEFGIAIAFIGLTDDASEALMEYTRRCQDIVLGLTTIQGE